MSDPKDAAIRAYAAHAEIVGTVACAWNGAQESLYLMFVALMGMRKAEAEAIFFALKADSAQRNVTRDLANVVLAANTALLKRTKDVINALGDLGGERNAAVHTMWRASVETSSIGPSPLVKHHGALKPNHRTQFFELARKLVDLEGTLMELADEIRRHLASPDKSQ